MSLDIARQVLQTESKALRRLADNLDHRFVEAVDILESCRGRIVLTGMGKSGIIARKISATLASTGSPSLYLHPAEAIHGDLGMLARGDVVLALSNSGATPEIMRLLEFIKRLSIPLIVLTGHVHSQLGRSADVCLDTGDLPEACPLGLAPTTSTTAALALGDALAIALSIRKGFKLEDFAALHPGGKLGKKLRRIEDLMRTGDALPRVTMGAPMKDVIYVMSAGRMGATAVTDDAGHLVGVITDGDLRRMLSAKAPILDLSAGECMTPRPKTIDARELATSALNKMETNKITSLYIVDDDNVLIGAIHLHDLWETEMF
ncbi:MAG: KpsF/GutQ family sugar-phosphate isomerase [Acidobacteria bacterium]|nr:KpsF/GutQ family sugar-phosphate isomerase [Acidobacteriota bacterium]